MTVPVLLLIVAAALLGACGNDGGGDPTGVDAPTGGGAPIDTEDGSTHRPPAFPESPAPQTRRSPGRAQLVLTDVRVGNHDRFDRIVLEFSGTGDPGWSVNYVEEARLEGSGDAVALGGDATLDIYAFDTTWPALDYYDGPERLEAEHGGLTDVYVAGTFEGYTQVLAGIDGAPVPFRVFTLADPSRLVVDVADEAD